MADETRHVEEIFHLTDKVSAPLRAILGGVNKVSSAFNSASHLVGSFASIGAVVGASFSLHGAVEGTLEYIGNLKKISVLTGANVKTADGLVEAFEGVGIKGEDAVTILGRMTRSAEKMEMSMAAASGAMNPMRSMWKQIGVDLRKGPVDNLVKMAELAKKNRLSVTDLQIQFRMPMTSAMQMMRLLKQGPEHIREAIREGRITEEDVANAGRMKNAKIQISQAFEQIQRAVGTKLLPVLADLLEMGAKKMKGWVDIAARWGQVLGRFLRDHYTMVLRIGKALLANYALMKFTGQGAGGNLRSFAGFSGLGRIFTSIGGGAGGVLGWVKAIGRFTVVGAVLLVAVKAFEMIKDNALGVRDYLVGLWTKLTDRFSAMQDAIAPIIAAFMPSGPVGGFFSWFVDKVIHGLGTVIDVLVEGVQNIVNMFAILWKDPKKVAHPFELMLEAAQKTERDMSLQKAMREAANDEEQRRQARARLAAQKAAARDAPDARGRQPYYDFRNSKFSITQSFAEGFDPDRVAVAFANDLAGLGERKLQSGFSPLFAIR